MAYKHMIEVLEKKTTFPEPLNTQYGVQVIVGTAPVNLAEDPYGVTNQVIAVTSFEEVQKKLGYSEDWESYTLCASMYASFQLFSVNPVVFINVLDPTKHKKEVTEESLPVENHQIVLEDTGILKDTVSVKKTEPDEAYVENTDYILSFNEEGKIVITFLSSGAGAEAQTAKVSAQALDPSLVKETDIIGAYDMESGLESGLELIRKVYPSFGYAPGLLLAPGWSHKHNVGAALQGKCTEINGIYRCECVIDLDTETVTKYTEAATEKENAGYTDPHAIVLWPMLNLNGKPAYFSAIYGAMASYYTAENGDVPYIYPSNKLLNVSGAVLSDGTEILLDTVQAGELNGEGVVTAISENGWRAWGNNTGCYPENTDPKDRFIGCRRMFSFVANYFIRTYRSRLDDLMNKRVIEDIVNSFNIWGNSMVAQGMCAGIRMEYREEDNSPEDLMNGKLSVRILVAPYTPIEYILATEEFDIETLQTALTGTEE